MRCKHGNILLDSAAHANPTKNRALASCEAVGFHPFYLVPIGVDFGYPQYSSEALQR